LEHLEKSDIARHTYMR